MVERTFGWFGFYRRLAKDYERYPRHSEAFVYLAMSNIMLQISRIGVLKHALAMETRPSQLYLKNGYKETGRERKPKIPFDSIFYEKDLV